MTSLSQVNFLTAFDAISLLLTDVRFVFLFILAVFLIRIFYYVLQSKWPEVYFSAGDAASSFISVDPLRYFLFRFGPVFFISAVILSVADGITIYQRILGGILLALVHLSHTNFLSIYKLFRDSDTVHRYLNSPFQIVVHIGSSIVVIFAGAAGGWTSSFDFMRDLTPTFDAVRDNIWSSAILAVFVVFFYKIFEKKEVVPDLLVLKSLAQIPVKIIHRVEEAARKNNASKNLLLAIAVVENLQRPKWFRSLERIKSLFFGKGTYGIMQVSSNKYINDEISVDIAAKQYFENTSLIGLDPEAAYEKVRAYNPREEYVSLVMLTFELLERGYDGDES